MPNTPPEVIAFRYRICFSFLIEICLLYYLFIGMFPAEMTVTGKNNRPLDKIGISPPQKKLIYMIADGVSFRIANNSASEA